MLVKKNGHVNEVWDQTQDFNSCTYPQSVKSEYNVEYCEMINFFGQQSNVQTLFEETYQFG